MLGTSDDGTVHAYAKQFFNQNRFVTISDVTLLVKSYEVSHLGGDAWEVVAHYESQGSDSENGQPLKRSRSFDTAGQTTHITVAIAEKKFAKDGDTAPDMYGAINADEETVHGVDIVIPQFQWQETYDVPSSTVSESYVRTLASLTGGVNDGSFRGFEAGEVLFLGASGSQQADEEIGLGPWSLTYKFSASPNQSNMSIGGITGIDKKGHEYLWVRYGESVDSDKASLLKKPRYIYVDQVYRKVGFGGLGIGG
jgi:hypothetical protein